MNVQANWKRFINWSDYKIGFRFILDIQSVFIFYILKLKWEICRKKKTFFVFSNFILLIFIYIRISVFTRFWVIVIWKWHYFLSWFLYHLFKMHTLSTRTSMEINQFVSFTLRLRVCCGHLIRCRNWKVKVSSINRGETRFEVVDTMDLSGAICLNKT